MFYFLCLVDERSSVGFVFVFVFLLETGLCFCVWLTREIYCWVCVYVLVGDRFVFYVLVGYVFLSFVFWVCVLGSGFGFGFFLKKIFGHVIFCF